MTQDLAPQPDVARRGSLATIALQRGGGIPSWSTIRAVAQELEASGLEVLDLVPGGEDRGRWPYEPTTLGAAVLRGTRRISVVIPVDPHGAAPYHFARYLATLGYIGPGRVLLGTNDPADATESVRLTEFLAVVAALWDSWSADAIVADKEAGIYFDPLQVRDLDFDGRFYRVRGALNLPRPPGSFPLVIAANDSETGEQGDAG